MSFDRTSKKFSLTCAVVILALALIAKIPSDNCHCHSKKAATKEAVCPYAEMRALVATIESAPATVQMEVVRGFIDCLLKAEETFYLGSHYFIQSARAPPILS